MQKIFLFICLSMVFMSCKKANDLQFTTVYVDQKSKKDCFDKNCTYIHIEIPKAFGNDVIGSKINKTIYNFVNDVLVLPTDRKINSYDSLAIAFIKNFDEVDKTYPEGTMAWEANFKVDHKALSASVYQVVFDYYVFTGSAQALKAKKVFFFDLETGNVIKQEELFLNFEGFKQYAETEFYKQTNGKIDSSVRVFEGGEFQLPQNFYLEKNNWFFHYNRYELATNALTETVVTLPNNSVASFLNPLYFNN